MWPEAQRDLVALGATVFRHNENGRRNLDSEEAPAKRIVAYLVHRLEFHVPEVLQLQREIIDQKKTLGETTAGIAASGDLNEARQAHEKQLRKLRTEMKNVLAKTDAAHAAELQELKLDVEKKLTKAEEDEQALQKTMQDMHLRTEKAWIEKLEELDKRFQGMLVAKDQEVSDMEESLKEILEDMTRESQGSNQQEQNQAASEAAEYQKIVDEARLEADKARESYERLHGRNRNVLNGTVNGLAAGTTSGIIAAVAATGLLCVVM
ncbi:hypothetical protein ACJ41O_000961 [Fusarium nematophilum]